MVAHLGRGQPFKPLIGKFNFFAGTSASGVGTANGSSTASGVGASQAASIGTANGSSTASAVGNSQATSVGTASGSSTASAVGSSQAASVATANGNSTASAVGSSNVVSIATANGSSTASAVGSSISGGSGIGTASGSSSASAVSSSQARSVGTSNGNSTASAVSSSIVYMYAVGTANGSSSAEAVSNNTAYNIPNGTNVFAICSGAPLPIAPFANGQRQVAIANEYGLTLILDAGHSLAQFSSVILTFAYPDGTFRSVLNNQFFVGMSDIETPFGIFQADNYVVYTGGSSDLPLIGYTYITVSGFEGSELAYTSGPARLRVIN